jgi:hypothetical protein
MAKVEVEWSGLLLLPDLEVASMRCLIERFLTAAEMTGTCVDGLYMAEPALRPGIEYMSQAPSRLRVTPHGAATSLVVEISHPMTYQHMLQAISLVNEELHKQKT